MRTKIYFISQPKTGKVIWGGSGLGLTTFDYDAFQSFFFFQVVVHLIGWNSHGIADDERVFLSFWCKSQKVRHYRMTDEADMLLLFLLIEKKKILNFPFEFVRFFLPLKAGPEFDKKKIFFFFSLSFLWCERILFGFPTYYCSTYIPECMCVYKSTKKRTRWSSLRPVLAAAASLTAHLMCSSSFTSQKPKNKKGRPEYYLCIISGCCWACGRL